MLTSVKISEKDILNALNSGGSLYEQVREKFNKELQNNTHEAVQVAQNVVRHILKDLDDFFERHQQV